MCSRLQHGDLGTWGAVFHSSYARETWNGGDGGEDDDDGDDGQDVLSACSLSATCMVYIQWVL